MVQTITAVPQRRLVRKLTLVTAWGQGLDGYDLGVISVALPLLIADLNMSAISAGLIGASSLIGIFLGGPVFGWLTDRIGRRRTFTIDLALFLVTALAQVAVDGPGQLFAIRLVMGMAIGAEYAIGAPMLSEFCPTENRGKRVSLLEVAWYVGYVAAVAVSYGLSDLAGLSWRWVLVSGAVPAVVCLVLRRGLPESPRWLASRGRTDEAREIANAYLGGEDYFVGEGLHREQPDFSRSTLHALFAPGQRSRTIFGSVFFACLVAPYFAIFTFAPVVLDALHIRNESLGTIALNMVALFGSIAGMLVIERIGRRKLLIGPFWITGVALLVLGVFSDAPSWLVVICFLVFAFFNAAANDLTPVYPNELYPTAIRTTGTGMGTAASRIGAAVGTFLLPTGLDTIGVGPTMLVAAGICVVGALTSQWLAPETTGVTLTDAAGPATASG